MSDSPLCGIPCAILRRILCTLPATTLDNRSVCKMFSDTTVSTTTNTDDLHLVVPALTHRQQTTIQELVARSPNATSLRLTLDLEASDEDLQATMHNLQKAFVGRRMRSLHLVNADQAFERHFQDLANLSHLESLVIECHANFCWPSCAQLYHTLTRLDHLTSLSILSPKHQLGVSDSHLAAIAAACGTRLQALVICADMSDLTDNGLTAVGRCQELKKLVLSGAMPRHCCHVKTAQLCITAWPFADATCSEVTPAGLYALLNLQALEELAICMDGSSSFVQGCKLPHLPNLRSLRFEGRPEAAVLSWIARDLSAQLQTVHIWVPGNEFDKTLHCLGCLAALPRDVELHLCCDTVDVPFATLRQLSGLVSLQCSHMSMCAEDISHLEGLSTLRSLELYGVSWEGTSLDAVSRLSDMQQLQSLAIEFVSFGEYYEDTALRAQAALGVLFGLPGLKPACPSNSSSASCASVAGDACDRTDAQSQRQKEGKQAPEAGPTTATSPEAGAKRKRVDSVLYDSQHVLRKRHCLPRPPLWTPPSLPASSVRGAILYGPCPFHLSSCSSIACRPGWVATAQAAMAAPWGALPLGSTCEEDLGLTGTPLTWTVDRSSRNQSTRVLTFADLKRWPGLVYDELSMPSDWDTVLGTGWEPVSHQLSCGVLLHRYHCADYY